MGSGPDPDGPSGDGRSDAGYRIGTVAHLTGIDAHSIRAWERRYGAIRPGRSEGGTRLYSDGDVARLQLIKALLDAGEPIGSVARLGDAALRERLARLSALAGAATAHAAGDRASAPSGARVAVLHPTLGPQLRLGASRSGIEVVHGAAATDAFLPGLAAARPEALVLGLDALGSDPLGALDAVARECADARVLVVYEFARRALLAKLAARGVRLLRGPAPGLVIEQAIADALLLDRARVVRTTAPRPAPPERIEREPEAPARLFDDLQLAQLREVRSSVECECPNHLASIIESLVAFEAYSRACESREAADAAVHARLGRGTARARAVVEQMLFAVCVHDGIRLEPRRLSIQ